MKEQTTCVVIADGTRAKFLTKKNHNLVPIMATHHANDDVAVHQDKGSSIPGKVSKGMVNKGTHSYPPHSDWYHFKKEMFAVKIAAILGSISKNYDKIILIAAPVVLGSLRQHLSPNILAKIVHEINKDLTKTPLKEVMEYVHTPFQ